MKSILITGSNRGLGLGMVKYLIKENKTQHIFATCRKESEELQQIATENKNVHLINIELRQLDRYEAVASRVASVVGAAGLNMLINNAGVTTKFTKLPLLKAEQLIDNLMANTVAPTMLAKTLLPLLKQAAAQGAPAEGATTRGDPGLEGARAAIVNMSSVLGSIASNDKGGFYPYRCSKAALNAATKSMSIDLRAAGIVCVSLHPGWVRTDMGGAGAPLDVPTSVAAIFTLLRSLRAAHSGKFLQYDGTELPW